MALDAEMSNASALLYPVKATKEFFRRIHSTFDHKFLRYLVLCHISFTGFFRLAMDLTLLPMAETALKISAAELQRVSTVIMFPGVLKPTFAIISDMKPLFGYHKRPYLLFGGFLGLFAGVRLSTGKFEGNEAEVDFVVAVMCVYFTVVIFDCLVDGKRAEEMHKNPASGSDLIAYSMVMIVSGQLAALLFGYYALQQEEYQWLYYCFIPLSLIAIVCTLMGELPEKKVNYKWQLKAIRVKVTSNQFMLAGLLMCMGICLVYLQTIEVTSVEVLNTSLILNVVLGLCIVALCKVLLPRFAGNVIVYAFCERLLSIKFQHAVNYWYTLPQNCVPDGPNFDYVYFNITNGFIALIFSGFGIWFFQEAFSSGRLRSVFWWSSGTRCIGSICDLLVVSRINLKWGIPDQVAYAVGNSCLEAMVFMLSVMPFAILIAKLVVAGTETTLISILSAASALGTLMASSLGALAIEYAGIQTNVEDPNQQCDWSNLQSLIFIWGVLCPLLCVPLTLLLIPNILVTSNFEMDNYSGEVIAVVNEDGTREEVVYADDFKKGGAGNKNRKNNNLFDTGISDSDYEDDDD